MKNCGGRKVRKHKEIKVVTSTSPWTSHQSRQSGQDENHIFMVKRKIGKIRKGVGYLSGFQDQSKVLQKCKKARYAIGNVSKKDLSKIIKEFEKIEKIPYEKKRPQHEPTDRYFHLARQLAKCMMRSDNLNWHDHGGYTRHL